MISPKPWPKAPNASRDFDAVGAVLCGIGPLPDRPDQTCCKHGDGPCEECGTTNARDALHTTDQGRGVVSRLTTRKKKKRS